MADYIKKISKSTVEKYLGIKLAPNKTVLGVDVASKNTGLAVISSTDSYIILEETRLIRVPSVPRKDSKSIQILLNRVDIFVEQVDAFKQQLIQKHYLDKVLIEDCHFGRNVVTLKTLARFGILFYERFRHITKASDFKGATTWRSIIKFKAPKKKALKKEVIDYIRDSLELGDIKLVEDEWEAIGLALAALKEEV